MSQSLFRMGSHIMVSGNLYLEMGVALNSGLMALSIRVSGTETVLMAWGK